MITDDERRNVAARLRELEHHYNKNWVVKCCELPAPVDDAMHVCCIDRLAYGSEICKRLADLIDRPTCEMAECSIDHGSRSWGMRCSRCGTEFEHEKPVYGWRYCPHCGAVVVDE